MLARRGGGAARSLLAEFRSLPPGARTFVALAPIGGALLAGTGALGWGSGAPDGAPLADGAWLLAVCAYACGSAWLSAADLRAHRLPNAVLGAAALGTALPLAVAWVLAGEPRRALVSIGIVACAGALAAAAWLLAAWFRAAWLPAAEPSPQRDRSAIGAGDVKLLPLAVLGATLSAPRDAIELFPALLAAALLVVACAAALRLTRHRAAARPRADLALGPAILAASWLAPIAGTAMRAGT